jgi:hypothetical protein
MQDVTDASLEWITRNIAARWPEGELLRASDARRIAEELLAQACAEHATVEQVIETLHEWADLGEFLRAL